MSTAIVHFIKLLLGSSPIAMALLLCPTLMGSGSAGADVLHVPGEYNSIQHALAFAGTCDTVLVAPGHYYEDLVWPGTQGINLLSKAGADSTTIDALGYDRVLRIDTNVDSTTLISGFTITNGNRDIGGGILCDHSHPTICGNIITGNTATSYGAGIHCVGTFYYPIIDDNIISGNTVHNGSGAGICCYDGSAPRITNNTFNGNSANTYYGGAIHCENTMSAGREIVISGNTFEGNTAHGGGAISLVNPFEHCPSISNNVIFGNSASLGGGICALWTLADIEGNIIRQNHATEYGGGIFAELSHDLVIRNNEIDQNTALGPGGGIALTYLTTSPTVSGNTITHNTAGTGGGVYCYYRSSPIMLNNYIGFNEAITLGGGIACEDRCSPLMSGNIIMYNEAGNGGGISIFESDPRITDCTISENANTGIYFIRAAGRGLPVMDYNSISGNGGYGVCSIDSCVAINGLWNWWGHETGPYHKLLNPGGQGDRVSDHVAFIPWLESPGGVAEVIPGRMESVLLLDCHPNPFRKTTTIRFQVPPRAAWETESAGMLSAAIKVYDVAGRLVRSLQAQDVPPGMTGEICWGGEDNSGFPVTSGVHYIRMQVGGQRQVRKVVLLR